MIKYVEANSVLYEIDDVGERVLVRSTESTRRAYVRFTNRTGRPLDIWWRDYRGKRHHYMRVMADSFYDVNTFLTHPWEFTDAATRERYVIKNAIIYRAPTDVGGMKYRTNWNVTISVRSLRHTALLVLAKAVPSSCSVRSLGLPQGLEAELVELTAQIHGPLVPIPSPQ